MRLIYLLFIASAIAMKNEETPKAMKSNDPDWHKKLALQTVEGKKREDARQHWKASELSFQQGNKAAGDGQMQDGFEASSISQTLQKTVGRLGMAKPDSRIIIKGPSDVKPTNPQQAPVAQRRGPRESRRVSERSWHENSQDYRRKRHHCRNDSQDRCVAVAGARISSQQGRLQGSTKTEQNNHLDQVEQSLRRGDRNPWERHISLGSKTKKEFAGKVNTASQGQWQSKGHGKKAWI